MSRDSNLFNQNLNNAEISILDTLERDKLGNRIVTKLVKGQNRYIKPLNALLEKQQKRINTSDKHLDFIVTVTKRIQTFENYSYSKVFSNKFKKVTHNDVRFKNVQIYKYDSKYKGVNFTTFFLLDSYLIVNLTNGNYIYEELQTSKSEFVKKFMDDIIMPTDEKKVLQEILESAYLFNKK